MPDVRPHFVYKYRYTISIYVHIIYLCPDEQTPIIRNSYIDRVTERTINLLIIRLSPPTPRGQLPVAEHCHFVVAAAPDRGAKRPEQFLIFVNKSLSTSE